MEKISSGAKAYAFRLKPKDDLKKSILAFAEENKIRAGSIVTCVGSLEQFRIRFANQRNSELKKGFFEIVSLTGTFSNTSCHLHISISDLTGITIGGHLLDDNIVYTTAEIIILELTDFEFKRELDSTYGFNELVIEKRKQD
jgi:predicted DNA-binding protein with PD1-like motif